MLCTLVRCVASAASILSSERTHARTTSSISSVEVGMLWRFAASTAPAALNSRSADADEACIAKNARAEDMKWAACKCDPGSRATSRHQLSA